ncbi:unnamed protein product [Schistocephalus solidus]|uniref:C2H2-type domain-containing protein n=1 Tax=Schistocephalus solidus TaxID=70667 RepID=A0A183TFD1_SCHSO|nr:unnamed protein product [Schistocephalus solidus]
MDGAAKTAIQSLDNGVFLCVRQMASERGGRREAGDQKSSTKVTRVTDNTANAQALPTCPCCQRTFRTRIGLVVHLRTQCTNNLKIPTSTSNSASSPSDSLSLTPGTTSIIPTIIETKSQCSSPVNASTTATAILTTISDGDSPLNCLHCDRTFT